MMNKLEFASVELSSTNYHMKLQLDQIKRIEVKANYLDGQTAIIIKCKDHDYIFPAVDTTINFRRLLEP